MSTQIASQSVAPAPVQMPDYLVGLDPEGHWIAVETHGLGGGIFRSQEAALDFARFETARRPGAVHPVDGTIQLRI